MKSSSALVLLAAVVSVVVLFSIFIGNSIMTISSIIGVSVLVSCYFSHFIVKKLRANRYQKFEEVIKKDFEMDAMIPGSVLKLLKNNLKYKINRYITLKLENGKTFIYVDGKKFIQCIQLVLNIPKNNVYQYDEINSIDEVADKNKHTLWQNRIVEGPMLIPVQDQSHDITPVQEFWGHCSNIQAWVEHEYDTRILMSNISFPLLRELNKKGDPLAKKIFKEEIALRLESAYPPVVEYLINQGYIKYLTSEEFNTILENNILLANLFCKSKSSSLNRIKRRILPICLYCGKIIPRRKENCDWCGHNKVSIKKSLPYPYIFNPSGGDLILGNDK
ncbi:MAG: hypothetical protein ACFFEN_12095 [Candidatus Thorarchaeota archaeon]